MPATETGSCHRHARLDRFEDLGPTAWRQDRVGVTMHRGALLGGWLFDALNLPGDGLLYVTNVLGDYS